MSTTDRIASPPSPQPTAAARPRWADAAIGAAAAGAALAVGDLATAWWTGPSPVTAIGTEFIERYAARLKTIAVELFGTNDKRALLIGIVVVAVAIGAALGLLQRRWRAAVSAGFVAFGLLGAWAIAAHPLGSWGPGLAVNLGAVVAGVGTYAALARFTAPTETVGSSTVAPAALTPSSFAPPTDAPRHVDAPMPSAPRRVVTFNRRRFGGAVAGTVAVSAALAQLGKNARTTEAAAVRPQRTTFPRPERSSLPPAEQPFATPGLTPYVVANADFYRIDTALSVPNVNADSWSLTIDGLVDEPLTLTYAELLDLPSVEHTATIACVSNEVNGNLVGNAVWQGALLADLLERVGVHEDATQLVGHSVDGFTAGFPTAVARDGRTALVAYAMNGEALPPEHGYPVRLIVPGLYGYVSATKWLSRIELTRWEDFDGFWVPRGWAKEGPVKTMSRIDVPRGSDSLTAGPLAVAGVAWAPNIGIDRVEVQVDDGEWQVAELGRVANDDTWVQWKLDWDAPAGDHTIRARATDATGYTQTDEYARVDPDGATGYPTRNVTVG